LVGATEVTYISFVKIDRTAGGTPAGNFLARFTLSFNDTTATDLPSGTQQADLWISQVADYNATGQ